MNKKIDLKYAIIVPMANESETFKPFTQSLALVLDKIQSGVVFIVVDNVSTDNTKELSEQLAANDPRFISIWAPENKNVVDAYLRGYKAALEYDTPCKYIIEMDAGFSHNPEQIAHFTKKLEQGYECVFGSRFVVGGKIMNSTVYRYFLSKFGTMLSNLLLGTKMKDMTSGFQGFQADIVRKFTQFPLKSEGHFYQTELKYLLRKTHSIEIPITYQMPSSSVSWKSLKNSMSVLVYYFIKRLKNESLTFKKR